MIYFKESQTMSPTGTPKTFNKDRKIVGGLVRFNIYTAILTTTF